MLEVTSAERMIADAFPGDTDAPLWPDLPRVTVYGSPWIVVAPVDAEPEAEPCGWVDRVVSVIAVIGLGALGLAFLTVLAWCAIFASGYAGGLK